MKPTWPVWCEIKCSEYRLCANTVSGQFNNTTMNRPTMRKEAVANGWKLIAGDWICPSCIRKANELYATR